MITKFQLFLFSSCFFFFGFDFGYLATSQESDLQSFQKKYSNDVGVILKHNQTISIAVNKKTKELDIFETDYEEVLYLKKSAKFYTDQSISLSEFFEDIVSIEVTIIKPNGKKLKLKEDAFRTVASAPSSWVFHDDDKEIVFDLPELGEGYRTIIEYTKKVKRPEFFDVFHFVSYYPVESAQVEISYPNDLEINFFERNFETTSILKSELTGKKGVQVKKWELTQIPAYKSESGSTNINNHIPHLLVQIRSYKCEGETYNLVGSLEELHDFFQKFLLLKDDESNRKEINDVVRSLIANKTTDLEKMDTIYNWVQTNIKYIAFEDGINGYVPRSCSEVMKNRYGDCKDMSNLLVEMLLFAGIKNVYVAWVGTKDIPYQMSEIPSPLTCNHVICVVEKEEGGYYYLDATGSEMGFLLPPSAIQEKEILVHKGTDKFDLYKVPAVSAETNYFKTVVCYTFVEGDSIHGQGTDYLGGYERELRSYDLKNLDNEDLYDYVKEICLGGRNRFTLKDYEILNLDNNNNELQIEYDFSVDNLVIEHEGEYILNPVLFKPRVTKFSKADYKYDRSKDHHRTVDYLFEFEVPQGYTIKHIPEDIKFEHDLFWFESGYNLENNKLIITMKYQYKVLKISPDQFEDWNKFSDEITRATTQNIILEKIEKE